MLSLDQVRAVNDGFSNGDLNAALRPLEETVDLRQNELPRLDKAALARLKADLSQGENAATWAEAAFHPNVSLRRFVRRVFMGLGDEAAPLALPLRARIERFWNEETPLEWSTKPREAAARREQNETLSNALELFLRADPERFVGFWTQLLDSSSGQNETVAQGEEWRKRSQLAAAAQLAGVNRLLEEEWGAEWLASDKRWKLPSRVLRELDERARQNPEVARLQAEVGETPWQRATLEWQPAQLFAGALSPYLNNPAPTAPMRRVAGRVRPILQTWIEGAFDEATPLEERRTLALRLSNATHIYTLVSWLGQEWMMETLVPLLLRVKPAMLPDINRALKAMNSGNTLSPNSPNVPFNTLWVHLAQWVGQLVEREFLPYYQKSKTPLPASLTPEMLRELAQDLNTKRNRFSITSSLLSAAKSLEKEQAKQPETAPDVASLDQNTSGAAVATASAPAELLEPEPDVPKADAPVLQPNEALSSQQVRDIYAKDGYTPEAQAKIDAEVRKAEGEMAPDKLSDDEKVARLVEPPPHPRDPNRIILRMPYWKVWTNRLQGGAAELRERVWKRAEPQLWARLEEKLEEYRRVETDPVEEKIEKKLSQRELKTWKTDRRREKRALVAREINDIENLLVTVDGLGARLKVIELKDRPSCRDLRDQSEQALWMTLAQFPGDYGRKTVSANWKEWKLGPEWDAILEKAETRLGEVKDEWRLNQMLGQLATGYYRRGNFDKFAHYAALPGAFSSEVAAATLAFDDFEAWQVLTRTIARWGGDDLQKFWQEQLKNPERRARALESVVETLSATGNENVGKPLLLWLSPISLDELRQHAATIERALESSLVPVKRWALTTLGLLQSSDWNREHAAQIAGEALWNENAGLVKDAAKFLSQLAIKDAEVAPIAWESLCDATALENLPLCEAMWKALAQIKAENKSLVLTDAARERLDELSSAQSDRFGKFLKKFSDL